MIEGSNARAMQYAERRFYFRANNPLGRINAGDVVLIDRDEISLDGSITVLCPDYLLRKAEPGKLCGVVDKACKDCGEGKVVCVYIKQ